MKPNLTRFLLIGGVVAGLGGAAGLLTHHRLGDALTVGEPSEAGAAIVAHRTPLAAVVTVAEARERAFTDRLFVSGTLVAREEAMVGAQIDGLRIVDVLAEDGDHVERGQVLARLDRSQLDALLAQNDAALARADAAIAQARSQIDQFEATSAQASADLARARKLDLSIVTQATLDQRVAAARAAQAQVEAARSALAVAQADKTSRQAERRELLVRIGRTEVKAPVAGIVSRRTARLGALAMGSSEPLFRIIEDGAVDLEAEVPEDSLTRLALGMTAKITIPGLATPLAGRIRLISSEVDKTSRLGKVRIALPKETAARIGAFASGTIEVARRTSVGVPSTAVTRADGVDSVQVVENRRVGLRAVTAGTTNGDFTEVRSGLKAGELVVVRAAPFLREGDEVRPVTAASAEREAAK